MSLTGYIDSSLKVSICFLPSDQYSESKVKIKSFCSKVTPPELTLTKTSETSSSSAFALILNTGAALKNKVAPVEPLYFVDDY